MSEEPVRVLFVIANLQQGGAERQILQLMRNLPPRFQPSLCVFEDVTHYRELLPAGEPRYVLGSPYPYGDSIPRMVEVLRQARPHVVHSFRDVTNYWVRRALPQAPVPVVITNVRSRAMSLRTLATEWFLSRRSDRILANSEGIRTELVHLARVQASRIQVIHNIIDADTFQPPTPEQRASARARFGLAPDEIALILPGRLSIQKNQLGLVRALGQLAFHGHLPPSVRVLFAGRTQDRFIAGLLPRLERWFGVGAVVRHLGAIPAADMPALYHAGDALVMPSWWEGLPNAVLEAHLSGLPAVVSHAANVDGMVLDGVTGFEVPTLDVAALAIAVRRLLEAGPERRRAMGARGRDHLIQRFAPARVVGEVVALYDSLLATKGVLAAPAAS